MTDRDDTESGADEGGNVRGDAAGDVFPSEREHEPVTAVDPEGVLDDVTSLDVRAWRNVAGDVCSSEPGEAGGPDPGGPNSGEGGGLNPGEARGPNSGEAGGLGTGDASAVERVGPAAEEFRNVLGVGVDADAVSAGDVDGVTLAAVQAVVGRLDEQSDRVEGQARQIEHLHETVEAQRDDVESLRQRLESLQAEISRLRRDDERVD